MKASRKQAFLAAFARTGNITCAARIARCDRSNHYVWINDKEYARAFAVAEKQAVGLLEDEAMRRAVEGVPKPLVWQGQITYQVDRKGQPVLDKNKDPVPVTILEYSDPLLMFLLRGANPAKYRERYQVQHSGNLDLKFEGELVELLGVYHQLSKGKHDEETKTR